MSEIAGNIIQILAGLPEFLRKPMVKSRLSEFFTFPDAEKIELVTNILNAAPNIDFKALSNLVRTWMEVLCDLEEEKRSDIFATYANVIADSPDILKLDVDELVIVFNSLPGDKKDLLANTLRRLISDLPEQKRARILEKTPQGARTLLGL